MTNSGSLEQTFPGMEGMVSDTQVRNTKTALDLLFDKVGDEFRYIADEELAGIETDPKTGQKRLIAYDLVEGHEVIVMWGLDQRGKTRSRGTFFVNQMDYPDVSVSAYEGVRLGKSIKPDARHYDIHGDSIPLTNIFQAITEKVGGLLSDPSLESTMPTEKALGLLREIKPNEVHYIESSNF